MKNLIIIATVVTVAVGSAIPLVPEDNTHYVQGESRYIWVADEDSKPQLVDLHAPIDPAAERGLADIQYWLYTRKNPRTPQILKFGDINGLQDSNYLGSRPLKVILHGYGGSGNSHINFLLRSSWLAVQDANIIVVDWSSIASANYVTAVFQAPAVGRTIGTFLTWLINTSGGSWDTVHLAGFSLGGQIAGITGRITAGKIRRVTSLDPMSPLWYNNPHAIREDAGQYVEVIHTQYAVDNPPRVGHVDFYPNGGRNQPGCFTSICSHLRSFHLFSASILFDHLVGRQCADVEEAQQNRCTGSELNMGNAVLKKQAVGFYALSTGSNYPF